MRYKLHCLKLEKESIRAEQEEVKEIINKINSYRLNRKIIKRCQSLINRLNATENATTEKITEFENKIKSIPDAEVREMAKLYFVDLMCFEKIGDMYYLDRTTVEKKLKKHFKH